jgi:hypothetical protein
MSGTLFRMFLAGSAVLVLYLMLMQPAKLKRLGRGIRVVGIAYVLAILISSVLRLTLGWGT